jgi:hypothetical protein
MASSLTVYLGVLRLYKAGGNDYRRLLRIGYNRSTLGYATARQKAYLPFILPLPRRSLMMQASQRGFDDAGSRSMTTHTHADLGTDPSWFDPDELATKEEEFAKFGFNEYNGSGQLPPMSQEEDAAFTELWSGYQRSISDLACHPDSATSASCADLSIRFQSCLSRRAHPAKSVIMMASVVPDIFYAYFKKEKPSTPISETSMGEAVQHLTQIQRVLEGAEGGRIRDLKKDFQLPDGWMERLTNARISVGFPKQLDGTQLVSFLALVRKNILCKAEKEGPPKDITSVQSTDGSGLNPPHIS